MQLFSFFYIACVAVTFAGLLDLSWFVLTIVIFKVIGDCFVTLAYVFHPEKLARELAEKKVCFTPFAIIVWVGFFLTFLANSWRFSAIAAGYSVVLMFAVNKLIKNELQRI